MTVPPSGLKRVAADHLHPTQNKTFVVIMNHGAVNRTEDIGLSLAYGAGT
jgi:hypothetical protein